MIEVVGVIAGAIIGAYLGAKRGVNSKRDTPALSSSGVSVPSSPETPDDITRKRLEKFAPRDNVRPYGL